MNHIALAIAAFLAFFVTTSAHSQKSSWSTKVIRKTSTPSNPLVKVTVQLGHTSPIESMAADASGRFLVTSDRSTIKLWDAERGLLLRTLSADATKVAISPDGRHIAADSANDPKLMLWRASDGKLLRTLGTKIGSINDIRFVNQSNQIAAAMIDGTVRIWDVGTGKQLTKFVAIKQPRDSVQNSLSATAVAFTKDGRFLATASEYLINRRRGTLLNRLRIWNRRTGKVTRTIDLGEAHVEKLEFSPDGQHLLVLGYSDYVGVWNVKSAKLMLEADKNADFNCDMDDLVQTSKGLKNWINAVRTIAGNDFKPNLTPCGHTAVLRGDKYARSRNSGQIEVINLQQQGSTPPFGTPKDMHSLSGLGFDEFGASSISPNAKYIALSSKHGLQLLDSKSGRYLRTLVGTTNRSVRHVSFSLDSRVIVATLCNNDTTCREIRAWDVESGIAAAALNSQGLYNVHSIAVLPNSKSLLASVDVRKGAKPRGELESRVITWDLPSGRQLSNFKVRTAKASTASSNGENVVTGYGALLDIWDVRTGRLSRRYPNFSRTIEAVALSPDQEFITIGFGYVSETSEAAAIELRYAKSNRKLWRRKFETVPGRLGSPKFSNNKNHLVFGLGRSIYVLNTMTGVTIRRIRLNEEVRSISLDSEDTLFASDAFGALLICRRLCAKETIVRFPLGRTGHIWTTPAGFFEKVGDDPVPLHLVSGLDAISLDYVYEHLHRPDLVQALLGGDPEGRYKDAAHKLSIDKILATGPAPQIEHLPNRGDRAGNTVRISVRLTSQGGGIGKRLLWRVNGVTQGRPAPSELATGSSPLSSRVVTETLKLKPGVENLIQVTAFNRAGVLASQPLKISINRFGTVSSNRPRMFVLSIGVDNYRAKSLRLNYAANDARTFAKALSVIGRDLFSDVQTRVLTDSQVTNLRIKAAVEEIAQAANPEDVFLLFLGGHGKSIAGRYYYYPQSLDFSKGQTVQDHAIGQQKWEKWLAKIPVQKSLLVIDTCEGGAFRGKRDLSAARDASMSQLQHATGRNVIAASRDAAYEGYNGHGILTYAILESLEGKVGLSRESVRVSEVAHHIGIRVPEISQQLFGIYQNPTRMLSGNDFPTGIRQSVISTVSSGKIPNEPTHMVVRNELLRELPKTTATSSRELEAGQLIRVVEFSGEWVVIAIEGQRLGYFPRSAILRMKRH